MSYESAGTVEYLYDAADDRFYFLEVNTRLQVEHGVTEEVNGVDLVEWMVRQAAGEMPPLDQESIKPRGASIQARLYAEDPGRDFRPSSGLLTHVAWPADTRVETWVESGSEVSPFYDPMLAKIIATGATRDEALTKLQAALDATEIGGLETNLDYLRQLSRLDILARGEMLTRTLQTFAYKADTIEVLAPGTQTTIQDWPGRLGYWAVGVPPSGPMDPLSFRLANRLIGNDEGAAAIETTLSGPTLQVQQRHGDLPRRRRAHRDARRRARALLAGVRRQGRAGAEARRRDRPRHARLHRGARRHRRAQLSRQPLDLHPRQVRRPRRADAPRRRCAAYRRGARRRIRKLPRSPPH